MPPKHKLPDTSATRPSKKPKSSEAPVSESKEKGPEDISNTNVPSQQQPLNPAGDPAAASSEREGRWELMNDTRVPLVVGKDQRDRLTLKLKHSVTKEEKTETYSNCKPEEVNWNDKSRIQHINKWRSQIFLRNKLGKLKEPNKFTPSESAYLELFMEMVKRVDKTLSVPNDDRIVKAFNEHFAARGDDKDIHGNPVGIRPTRITSSIVAFLRRTGGICRTIRDALKKERRSHSDDEDTYLPNISDHDIAAYLRDKTVPDPKKSNASGPSTAAGVTGLPNDKAVPRSPAVESATKETSVEPNQLETLSIPLSKPKEKVAAINAETSVISTPLETIARYKADGFNTHHFPNTDEEALTLHRQAKSKMLIENGWVHEAINDLDERCSKYDPAKTKQKFDSDLFNRDYTPRYNTDAARKGEKWHEESVRESGAAAVNGLLNAAVIPPLGYFGDLNDLAKRGALPDDDWVLAESNQAAIRKVEELRISSTDSSLQDS